MKATPFLLVGALLLTGCESEVPSVGGSPTMRRLTESQYRAAIADVFGGHIIVAGRFDPLIRTEGLLTVGAGRTSITASALERYAATARAIAQQVVSADNRDALIPCTPTAPTGRDDGCAATAIGTFGKYLFRRPLAGDELAVYVKVAGDAAAARSDFYTGLGYAVQGLLSAPDFIFVTETAEPDPSGGVRLDAYSKATRLSYALWNAAPDDALLSAAANGDLHTRAGFEKQVDRMMASPRFENGVRAFFSDMLALDETQALEKDTLLYPAFSMSVALDSREQLLKTMVHHLVDKDADYRKLFTTRDTFMSRSLGMVYRVPAANPVGWTPYTFPEGDPRAGIQNMLSFVALHSHPGKSSPTLRGKAIRELLLCQRIPDPPASVNFDQFNDPNSPNKTARSRLDAHATDPACSGCHKLMDPIGLALENFDGAGQLRTTENGETIDASGELDGIPFADPVGLGRAMEANPAAPSCVANRLYAYAVGRAVEQGEKAWMRDLENRFAEDEYRFSKLFKRIVTSRAFLDVKAPAVTSAQLENGDQRS